ncbi:kinase-like domain-containing protein [Sphaerosporella brunnea]|uniref:non-specific serine/threonine protein kinase n=1 Tax=Sphaerosporella brunnea TaxID=1250544 RepID=A0A5J5F947_9PEZI|nr:kinase-like domain-containing protein [Sphaerosporella brunnea]
MSPPPGYSQGELAIPPYKPRPIPSNDDELTTSPRRRPPPPPTRPSASKLPQRIDHKPESRLGQYRIIKTVGEGSFGKVKLAIHEVTGQKVALKMISRKNLTSRDMAGRVEREIAYLQLLRHPHIIKLYTVITTPQEIIMVIEYAGGELFDFLVSNGKVPEDSARRFFQQIICAVEYCHRHKIVHRDLKPENLLLDSNLNVKIADFGLSNIMTDGNFLKTSCGSPNYAAPEVIGGKLYAGPEVDVWSCGVILFVLLCGKLPFDDDYIPNLFKKISQGKYSMPSYLSVDAKDLISRMLVVNPIQRITIVEIRKHPWFKKNLPEYLLPPKEEFFDTGVDLSRLPQLEELERGPAERLEGELHEAVVGKLGSTMGYAKDDVQDALNKNEPSAIKDAYMIVRENQMMIPRLSMNAKNDGFMAQSPPAWDSYMPGSPPRSPLTAPHWGTNHTPSRTGSPLSLNPTHPASGYGLTTEEENLSASPQLAPPRSPASSISILPSSMPAYHAALMGRTNPAFQQPINVPKPRFTPVLTNPPPPPSSTPKKPRQTKWQFGIRSRNAPLEAVSCIYRALKKLGAEWVTEPPSSPDSSSPASSDSEEYDDELDIGHTQHREKKHRAPKDPWIIQARWRKFAPTRRASDDSPTTSTAEEEEKEEDCVFVHLTIQLYQLEHDNYLVDFKCAGYERLQPPATGGKKRVGFEETLGGDAAGEKANGHGGRRGEDNKEVNSPFPFLDAAGALIIALADAGD